MKINLSTIAALFIVVVCSSAVNGYESMYGSTELRYWDQSKAYNGYTLFGTRGISYLIDMQGNVVHTWALGTNPRLLDYNGNLLDATKDDPSGFQGFRELDWNGNVIWDYVELRSNYAPHHDWTRIFNKKLNAYTTLYIANKSLTQAQSMAAGFNPALLDKQITTQGYMLPDSVVEIKPTGTSGGTVVWAWHIWDHLIQDYASAKNNYGTVAQHPERVDANGPGIIIPQFWNHINGIDYNANLDQIILSVRGNSEAWVIDHSTTLAEATGHTGGKHGKGGDLLYRWGNPQQYDMGTAAKQMLYQQHDVQWISSECPGAGHILVFNNGLNRPAGTYSTVDEFAPPVDAAGNYSLTSGTAYGPTALTWTYSATPPLSFYSAEISGTERLPNGNTLICEGNTGRLFEVTAAGVVVWKYICPVTDTGALTQGSAIPADPRGGYMTAVFKARRYAPSYAAFTGKILVPGNTIEK